MKLKSPYILLLILLLCSCGKTDYAETEAISQHRVENTVSTVVGNELDLLARSKTYIQGGQTDEAISCLDSLEVILAEQNMHFIEGKNATNLFLLGFLTILVVIVFALRETNKRLVSATEEKVRMQIEKERVERLYADALVERDTLSKMAQATAPNPEMKMVIKERLALLNKVIASYITDSSAANKEANAQIEMLVSNREAFLESTRKSFEAGHPRFMAYLRSCGLSDWEVNYCCLYLVGLNGKEIGEYINLKRHYTYGSVIRQKLGLGEHDRNLANHLKNMLENPPA